MCGHVGLPVSSVIYMYVSMRVTNISVYLIYSKFYSFIYVSLSQHMGFLWDASMGIQYYPFRFIASLPTPLSSAGAIAMREVEAVQSTWMPYFTTSRLWSQVLLGCGDFLHKVVNDDWYLSKHGVKIKQPHKQGKFQFITPAVHFSKAMWET